MQKYIIIIIIIVISTNEKAIENQFFCVILIAICYCPQASYLHTFMKFDLFFISFSSGLHYVFFFIYAVHNLTYIFFLAFYDEEEKIYKKLFILPPPPLLPKRDTMKFTAERWEMREMRNEIDCGSNNSKIWSFYK